LLHHPEVHVTTGSTFDNASNLPAAYLKTMEESYGSTPLGLQEIQGLLVDDARTTLWTEATLGAVLWPPHQGLPPLKRLVIGVDPAVTHTAHSDETGLIVAGLTEEGVGVVLDDLSGKMAPLEWARRAVEAYTHYQADGLVAEVNNGGDLVQKLIQTVDEGVHIHCVRATRGKYIRAEPIAALYAQGRVFHTQPFPLLTGQLRRFPHQTTGSPDRLDALVWALTELMLSPSLSPLVPPPQVWKI
jgi:predicted phage terminase large subunit-like protein